MRFRDLCEELDKIMSLDLGFRGVVGRLYPAARLHAGKPLTQAAAEIIANAKPRRVLIITGFRVLPSMAQETDGPPGALILAKTLMDLEVEVLLAIEEESIDILSAGLDELGIKCRVVPLPVNVDLTDFSRRLFDEVPTDLVVFVEKAGSNDVGVYHNMLGVDVTRYHAKVEALLHEAQRRKCSVIAIGDGGNEVGFGLIRRAVELFVPRGRDCGCPCRRGIASSSKADLVVVSSASNIGCYAVSCALSVLKGISWPHDRDVEIRLLKAIINAGAIDGMSGKSEMKVDGIPVEVTASVVEMLKHITKNHVSMLKP
ncbi:MAG: glutamate cyclase domain-containing protein [Candidatus Nezhaarchaeales archaeon]